MVERAVAIINNISTHLHSYYNLYECKLWRVIIIVCHPATVENIIRIRNTKSGIKGTATMTGHTFSAVGTEPSGRYGRRIESHRGKGRAEDIC